MNAMRLITETRALCERVRLPAMRVVVGGALMIPAAAMMASGQLESLAEKRDSAELEQHAASDEVLRAWSERMMERERELVVASFAKEYRIPVTLAANIHAAAIEEKIPPKVAFGLVKAESSFRTSAVSPVGAVGLTQLMPATARWLVPGTTRTDLMDTDTNLRIGFKYLRQLMDNFDGNEQLALTAYNRGPGTVNRLISRGADPDNGYAEKVLTGNSEKHVRLMNAKFGPTAKKTTAKKTTAKKATARKPPAKKAPPKRAPARRG
jgi:soluble lytic murein transglycosylase-like protein